MAEGGQVRKQNLDLTKVANLAGYSSVTSIYTHLDKCLSLNWIGTDGRWYFIRSFDRMRAENNTPERTAAELRPQDVAKIDEFLLGAKISSVKRSKDYVRKTAGTKPKTSAEPYSCLHGKNKPYQSNHVSCSLIGKWFGISPASATRLKKRARQSGYLNYHNRYNRLNIPANESGNVSESVAPSSHLTTYKVAGRQYLAIRLTDAFTFGEQEHNYHLKTRMAL